MAALDLGVYAPLDSHGVLTVRTCKRDDQGEPIRVALLFTEDEDPPPGVTCPICSTALRVPMRPWMHPAETRGAPGWN